MTCSMRSELGKWKLHCLSAGIASPARCRCDRLMAATEMSAGDVPDKRYKCSRCGLPKAGHTCLNPPNPYLSGPSASVITGLLEDHRQAVEAPGKIVGSMVFGETSNRGYRCSKCGQPKKGHVCTAVDDSKRRRLDAGPPSAAAHAGTVAVDAVVVDAVAVDAVTVDAVAVEAVAVGAVAAVAVEASACGPQPVAQEAAIHAAAEASAASQLSTDDAELAAAEASAEQRVQRLRDDLERVEAAMISAQAELTSLRRERDARRAAGMAAALAPMPEPAPTPATVFEAAVIAATPSSAMPAPAAAAARSRQLGLVYRCKRCGQPKKGHVCTNPAPAGAGAGAETGELPPYGSAAAGHPAEIGIDHAAVAVGVHKRPRGRRPANKTWDSVAGRWVPIAPAAGAELVVVAEAQRGDALVEVVAEVVADIQVEAPEVEVEAEAEVEAHVEPDAEEGKAERVAGAALARTPDRARTGYSIEEID